MKLSVLCENTTVNDTFGAEHGLSLYLETQAHRILFDMGQTDLFLQNARKMGVDLSQADMAVLSHGHYDHGGGIHAFLQLNPTAPVYLHQNAFDAHYHGIHKYIGLDQTLADHPRLVRTQGTLTLAKGVTLYSCNHYALSHPISSSGLNVRTGTAMLPETFLHEQYLLIEENNRRILISGCSHKGILNIAGWFRPDILIGGFHLMNLDPTIDGDREQLSRTAHTLLQYPTRYYTGHCTGSGQYDFLKERMGERLEAIHAGTVLTL